MGSKTISLDDDAYEALKNQKRPGESFSDVIHRVFGPTQPRISEFHGLLSEEAAEELANVVQKMKDEDVNSQREPVGA